ncbi:MAG: hypothetical protein NTX63_02765 [Candidatus Peregrinibacteria bacterium]|nr:hypothetical protein [Candidatus Peregrinibacteria bacterium]
MKQIQKHLFFFFFLSLIFVGGAPHVAHAAAPDCQSLGGDTTVITSIVKDAQGLQYVNDNSGQNFFSGTMASFDNKAVYLPPPEMAACAQKVADTVYLKGWYWNDNIGWVSLYCPGDGGPNRGIPCGFVKYGVSIDTFGNLSGYAWSSVGWIRMTCKATPGFGDVDICAQSAFKVKVDLLDPIANYRTWFPYTYAWSDTIGWVMMDSIKVPWVTLVDNCLDPQKNPDICLREKDFVPVDILDPVLPDPAAIVLKPGLVNPGDDFPVTWNKIRYIGNANTDASGAKALNPVTQADVRNLIFRNVAKWKKVASTSCGDNGAYLMKFTASDEVFYCKGNVVLDASVNNWKGNKTIIVEDGNVYIKNNLYSTSGQFGIIALKSNVASKADTGNIYVGPDVREMRVQMYADGFVLPANANDQVASGADYAIAGADTLFGQLYIRGMIVAGNTGSYVVGTDVVPSDLSALRSVPANPFDSKKAIKWSDYFNAKQGLPVYIKDPISNQLIDLSQSTANSTFSIKEKLSAGDVGTLKTVKLPDPTKFKTVGGDPASYQEGVILQYEPPASTLGGFEGILGNAYKQTK